MQVSTMWVFATTLPAERESVAAARRFVTRQLASHDLVGLVDDISLVTSELATNACTHAATPFTVTLAGSPHRVLLAVQDGSRSVPSRANAGDLDECGRGLGIVNDVSRQWGVTIDADDGKSVWATFDAG